METKNKNIRYMDRPEDYKKLGVNPNKIELWEDGRRDNDDPGHWEWWYFDALMDDGTAVIIQFLEKSFQTINDSVGHPFINFQITMPDGKHYEEMVPCSIDDRKLGKDKCDVHHGANYFVGDFKNYHIHVEPYNGIAADIHLKSLTQPFRPGSAYLSADEKDEEYYTWLCSVPKGEVMGSLTVEGKRFEVHGFGYHDHQWGSINYMTLWNHWTWARHNFEDYSLLVFDMTSSKSYGFKHFPITFIEDKDGNIIFENTKSESCSCEVLEEYRDEVSGKDYPKVTKYIFNYGSKKVQYLLKENEILQNVAAYEMAPETQRAIYDKIGMKPSYTRYRATGELMIYEEGKDTIERKGELIYEFMYPGISYKNK